MDVIVHGGAGSVPDEPAVRAGELEEAALAGTAADSPETAVRAAIRVLEASPRFNAGLGSAVQSDGRIRTDAGLMTSEGDVGAACAMPGIRHAIEVAEAVRTETPHVLLAGERAVDFADALGIETNADLFTQATCERWEREGITSEVTEEQLALVRDRFGVGHGTVGAVATDRDRVVAGTSTGGRWFALAGRVGDVPQVGAGYFAGSCGGVSATGDGEAIARMLLAKNVVARLDEGTTPTTATRGAIEAFVNRTDARAGVIALVPSGDAGWESSSEAMQVCLARDGDIAKSPESQYL